MTLSQVDSTMTGMVFNVQRYSVHDGGGIRTIVFLKGCPLRCRWCSNPESQLSNPELARNTLRCLGTETCGFCLKACATGALSRAEAGDAVPQGEAGATSSAGQSPNNLPPRVDREKCIRCMECTRACPSKALIPYGIERTVKSVLDAVEQDSLFYARSGGGMTLSGGEPLMQGNFALSLLREAKKRRIDSAMECCGLAAWPVLEQACGLLRELLFDIKVIDARKHIEATGVDNTLILENFRRVMEAFPKLSVCVRTPVIPGVNDTPEDIEAILEFLRPYPHVKYELLAYHRLGTQKYAFLDREVPMGDVVLDDARMIPLRKLAAQRANA